jgi:hypothetical protein
MVAKLDGSECSYPVRPARFAWRYFPRGSGGRIQPGVTAVAELRINEQEKKCIQSLAGMFTEGDSYLMEPRGALKEKGIDVDEAAFLAMMGMMAQYGVIDNVEHADELPFSSCTITAKSVQVSRQIEHQEKQAKEPEDIVEQLKQTAKSNRYVAWIIIGFIVITAAVTFTNQSIQLLEKIGVLDTTVIQRNK